MANRKKMPRPRADETGYQLPEISPENPSPVAVYLRLNGISVTAAARALGVKWATMDAWAKGTQVPGIAEILEMTRVFKGAIMPEFWGAMAQVKERIAEMRKKQPKAIGEIKVHGDFFQGTGTGRKAAKDRA
jgi:hypothetical protein